MECRRQKRVVDVPKMKSGSAAWQLAAISAFEFGKTASADEYIRTGFQAVCVDNATGLLKLRSG